MRRQHGASSRIGEQGATETALEDTLEDTIVSGFNFYKTLSSDPTQSDW